MNCSLCGEDLSQVDWYGKVELTAVSPTDGVATKMPPSLRLCRACLHSTLAGTGLGAKSGVGHERT